MSSFSYQCTICFSACPIYAYLGLFQSSMGAQNMPELLGHRYHEKLKECTTLSKLSKIIDHMNM